MGMNNQGDLPERTHQDKATVAVNGGSQELPIDAALTAIRDVHSTTDPKVVNEVLERLREIK